MFCWRCGQENEAGSLFCLRCGVPLKGPAESQTAMKPGDKLKPRKKLLIGVLLAAAAVVCIAAVLICLNIPAAGPQAGNTSGNIVNMGIAAQQDGWIYYSNGRDKGKLYKVRTDGTEKTKLNDSPLITYINVSDGWVYYKSEHGISKIKTDGSEETTLVDLERYRNIYQVAYISSMYVSGEWIYYLFYTAPGDGIENSSTNIYRIRTDGSRNSQVCRDQATSMSMDGDWIYFDNKSYNNALYKIKTDGSGETKLRDSGIVGNMVVDGGWIYFKSALICVSFIPAGTASAQSGEEGFYVKGYDVNAVISEQNVYDVTETINIYFTEPKHGIYRDIPVNREETRETTSSTYLTTMVASRVWDVNVEGYDYKVYYNSDTVSIRIGSPDYTVNGDQKYVIHYKIGFGDDGSKDWDEVYYNIIGTDWPCTIDNVTFSITLPKEFDANKIGFSTGTQGTSGYAYSVSGNTVSGRVQELGEYEGLTMRIELPEGYYSWALPQDTGVMIMGAAASIVLLFLFAD